MATKARWYDPEFLSRVTKGTRTLRLNWFCGLLVQRLRGYEDIHFELTWSGKRDGVQCNAHAYRVRASEARLQGPEQRSMIETTTELNPLKQGYSVGSSYTYVGGSGHPNWCKCGRDIPRHIQVNVLRCWMKTLWHIKQNNIRKWGTGTDVPVNASE